MRFKYGVGEERRVDIVLRAGRLYGFCNTNRGRIGTIGRISVRVRRKRFITVIKGSNSNGDALLRVLKKLSAPAGNDIALTKGSLCEVGRSTLTIFHEEGVKFIFRTFGLISSIGI